MNNTKLDRRDFMPLFIGLIVCMIVMVFICAHQRAEIRELRATNKAQAETIARQSDYISDIWSTDWEHEIEVMENSEQ